MLNRSLPLEIVTASFTIFTAIRTAFYTLAVGIYCAVRAFISFGDAILDISVSHIRTWVFFLVRHSSIRANTLLDVVVYDRPVFVARFVICYVLCSQVLASRLRLRTAASSITPLATVMDIFANANWSEREIMDMFGLRFIGHSDMRRILADYGFWGFPARTDFPVVGMLEYSFSFSINLVFCFNSYFDTNKFSLLLLSLK